MSDVVPEVTVFCEGPPDNDGNPTHERFEVPYHRVAMGRWSSVWTRKDRWGEDGSGGRTRPGQQLLLGDVPAHLAGDKRPGKSRAKFQLRCKRCGFDEKRASGPLAGPPPEVSAILDGLAAAGVGEISMRALIAYAYGTQ